jgi:hypothetical protein
MKCGFIKAIKNAPVSHSAFPPQILWAANSCRPKNVKQHGVKLNYAQSLSQSLASDLMIYLKSLGSAFPVSYIYIFFISRSDGGEVLRDLLQTPGAAD